MIDLSGRWALVTGGTRGIGRAAGLELARAGARCVLTHRWGSVDPDALVADYAAIGAQTPLIVEADVSRDADTVALLDAIRQHTDHLDIFVSNAGLSARVNSLEDYQWPALQRTLSYGAWPLARYLQLMQERLGRYPRHVIAVSSDGPDHFYPGYDFVATSKAVLEQLAKALAMHLAPHDVQVNAVRFGLVDTEATRAFFGDLPSWLQQLGIDGAMVLSPEACGRAIVALCSGYLDALTGQVITVDGGSGYRNNLIVLHQAAQRRAAVPSTP